MKTFTPLKWWFWLFERVYSRTRASLLSSGHGLSSLLSRRTGVTAFERAPELIVSLTTIPERINHVHLCLDSLLRQSLKPDRLILWLSETIEGDRPRIDANRLPKQLTRLCARGLEIRWCMDTRSFRKIIPTLRAHPEALIVTADDDLFYPCHWLRDLYRAYENEPQYIHCHRAHLIRYTPAGAPLPYRQWDLDALGFQGPSLDLLPTGVGGVLYAPGHLHPEVLNEAAFLELCPRADDVWLKAMSLLARVSCKKVTTGTFTIVEIRIPGNVTLCSENLFKDGNDPQINAVAERYNVFRRVPPEEGTGDGVSR